MYYFNMHDGRQRPLEADSDFEAVCKALDILRRCVTDTRLTLSISLYEGAERLLRLTYKWSELEAEERECADRIRQAMTNANPREDVGWPP